MGLMVGLLCSREHRSPCLQALQIHQVAVSNLMVGELRSCQSIACKVEVAPDLEVEGTVDSILFGTKDGRKMLSHICSARLVRSEFCSSGGGNLLEFRNGSPVQDRVGK